MIARVWHGWTTPGDADEYERLLTQDLLPEFAAAAGDGFAGHRVLRRQDGDRVEFMTVLQFESWDAVERFAGPEYEQAHVPPAAQELLVEAEARASHYELRSERRPDR